MRSTDIITVPGGMDTSVAAAVAAGFIVRNADGSYSDAGSSKPASQAPAQSQEQQQTQEAQSEQQPAGEQIAALDEASEAIMTNMVTNVGSLDRGQGLEAVLSGKEIPSDLLARAGSQMGVEPEQVKAHVAKVISAFENQAANAVGKSVLDWAKVSKLDALRDAGREQAMSGTLNGYTALAREYMSKLPSIDPAMILSSPDAQAAGVRQERNGEITIYLSLPRTRSGRSDDAARRPWARQKCDQTVRLVDRSVHP